LSVPCARGFLLLRRAGGLWGISNADVDGLAARGAGYRISACGTVLGADEIVGVVESLSVRPPAPVLRRFWAEAPAGLAVYGLLPVVVVDPRHPPAALRLSDQEPSAESSGEPSDERRD
jgi:hypothetical protein